MAEINLTNDMFEQEVLQSDVPVLVDFWAVGFAPKDQILGMLL